MSKMIRQNRAKKNQEKGVKRVGAGLIDRVIDKLPFEVHVPSYQYCGPGTHLEKRLARGDPGINPLDAACKTHDIAYSAHKESSERSKADKLLQMEAIKRIFAKDASLGERAAAVGVAAAMKAKRTLSGNGLSKKRIGGGVGRKNMKKKQQISFPSLIKNAKLAIKQIKPDTIESAIKTAISATKQMKKGKCIREPRTIKLPSIKGGILPLIPVFAGLSALGSIVGSTASIVNAINQTKRGQRELEESKRHNQSMEEIAIGNKTGNGFYLRSNKKGNGYFLRMRPKNH